MSSYLCLPTGRLPVVEDQDLHGNHPDVTILVDVKSDPGPPVEKLLVILLHQSAPQAVPYPGPSSHPRLSWWWWWHTNPRGETWYPLEEKRIDKATIAKILLPTRLAHCQLYADRCK